MRWRGPEAHFAILPQDRYSGTGYARQRRPQRFHVYTSARDMSWQTGDVVDGPLSRSRTQPGSRMRKKLPETATRARSRGTIDAGISRNWRHHFWRHIRLREAPSFGQAG